MLTNDKFCHRAAAALVIGASLYTIALCFVNTHVAHITDMAVAVVDGALVLSAIILCVWQRSRELNMLLIALAANFLLLTFVSGHFEPKALRDPLVLIGFIGLGLRYADAQGASRTFLLVSALVLVFGLFEFFAPAAFTNTFNVIRFYSVRGMVDADALAQADSAFFISGARDGERMLFPVLGAHRVSSVFLEPVSMGNFGALAVAYALSFDRSAWRKAAPIAGIGLTVIILADARFGSMAGALFVLTRLLPLKWLRAGFALLPLIALAVLIGFALSDAGNGDDLATRLAGSGRLLLGMDVAAYFGLADYDITTVDSGYAYAFSAFGLPFCALLWFAFLRIPAATAQAKRLHVLMAVYICALLCISGTSLFALKTAALAFFVLGALSAPERAHDRAHIARAWRVQPQAASA